MKETRKTSWARTCILELAIGIGGAMLITAILVSLTMVVRWYTTPMYLHSQVMLTPFSTWTDWVDGPKVRLTLEEEDLASYERAYWTGYEVGMRAGARSMFRPNKVCGLCKQWQEAAKDREP